MYLVLVMAAISTFNIFNPFFKSVSLRFIPVMFQSPILDALQLVNLLLLFLAIMWSGNWSIKWPLLSTLSVCYRGLSSSWLLVKPTICTSHKWRVASSAEVDDFTSEDFVLWLQADAVYICDPWRDGVSVIDHLPEDVPVGCFRVPAQGPHATDIKIMPQLAVLIQNFYHWCTISHLKSLCNPLLEKYHLGHQSIQ